MCDIEKENAILVCDIIGYFYEIYDKIEHNIKIILENKDDIGLIDPNLPKHLIQDYSQNYKRKNINKNYREKIVNYFKKITKLLDNNDLTFANNIEIWIRFIVKITFYLQMCNIDKHSYKDFIEEREIVVCKIDKLLQNLI
jgi:hypothetical protein